MKKIIRELSDEEFQEIIPTLMSGGTIVAQQNLDIISILNDAKMNTKFFLKGEDYPLKPSGLHYILNVSKDSNTYDYKVSIRTLKDKSGWVLLKIPKPIK